MSHDLAYKIMGEENIDILIVSEPNQAIVKNTRWVTDKLINIAVWFRNKDAGIIDIKQSESHITINMKDYIICCCYISPNIKLVEYKKIVNDIFETIKQTGKHKILLGDINSKSPEWGSPTTDKRGEIWTEALAETDMVVCNTGEPTFIRGSSKTHIDVTCTDREFMKHITKW